MTEKGTVARKRIDKQLRAAVIRGVRLLDKKDSAWWNGEDTPPAIENMIGHIDIEKLDMALGSACVLGQRNVWSYSSACAALGIHPMLSEDQQRYGFNLANQEDRRGFSILTELWTSVIQSRRYPRRKIASDPWVKKANETWTK